MMMMRKIIYGLLVFFCLAAQAEPENITMSFVGDLMLAETPGAYIQRGQDPFKDFSKLLQDADISIGNLECVVGTYGYKEKKPYTFLAHPRVVPLLKKYFSAVSLANNHTGDFGSAAFSRMLTHLQRQGLSYFGGGVNLAQSHEPALFHRKGRTVAVLGYSGILPRSFESLEDRPGVAWMEDDFVKFDIQRARNFHKADVVIVYPHWGNEYEKLSSVQQTQMAKWMIDAGADAVVGGHPHVTQNIEIYKGKPIFYSLGNFVFNGFDDEQSNTGWLLQLEIPTVGPITWKIHEAKIDGKGIPRLNRQLP